MKYRIVNSLKPVRTKYTERNDIFPRQMHPDTRTAKEFFADMERRNFVKKAEEKARYAWII